MRTEDSNLPRWQRFGNAVINNIKEDLDKSSTRDHAEGALHIVRGRFREAAGKLYDNPELESEGAAEVIVGKIQEKSGQIKGVFGK